MTEAPSAPHREVTITFVDLVRFTSLTDVHGDLVAADAAVTFESITRSAIAGRAQLVKTIGDAMMLSATEPGVGLRCAADIIEEVHELELGIDARGGADHGPVIERNRDVFGSTVNRAARMASLADPGTIAVTRAVALAAGGVRLAAMPMGPRPVRGFREPVEVFRVDPCAHDRRWVVDPICGMRVDRDRSIDAGSGEGGDIGFCSDRCAEIFAETRSA
ncbi:MAG: adenylate/guanylate cyclase domain-containing protein [Acidimicrobiales bacterium]